MFQNIPQELQSLRQWVCWRLEDDGSSKPTKVPYCPHTGELASVSDPKTWDTFAHAIAALQQQTWKYSGIGFVFTADDPYAFIDLDDPQGDQETLNRQVKIFNEFQSYSELSPSGKGLHIIVKGAIPSGRKRSKIEIYSSGRYATFTGNVHLNRPIEDRQSLLMLLYTQMGSHIAQANAFTGDPQEPCSDDEVIKRALNAVNGDKFKLLIEGQWNQAYSSQSEADFAFIDIIAFYTQNKVQIARMFRASPLGQRKKAQRTDYVDSMTLKSFDRMYPHVDFDGLRNEIEAAVAASQPQAVAARAKDQLELFKGARSDDPAAQILTSRVGAAPPGLLGEIAQFIYAAAPRPVPEIALAGAIGFLAGICGRSYNISGNGLNQYVILIAATGTGKEAIAIGTQKLLNAIKTQVPASAQFVGPAEIASPQALARHLSNTSPCWFSVLGEFGIRLQQLCDVRASTQEMGLRRMLLDLYGKSGQHSVLQPTIYSDKEKNTKDVQSPSVTLIGETTASEFYGALDERMIVQGLLPRFFSIEYTGPRPPSSESHNLATPPFKLIQDLASMAASCLTLMHSNKVINVQMDKSGAEYLRQYDKLIDDRMNGTQDDVVHHLWSRSHMKVMKLAALVAVGINPFQPIVTEEAAKWAADLVNRDTYNLLHRFERGEVGKASEETLQSKQLIKVFIDFVTKDYVQVARYGVSAKMHNEHVVPMQYIQRRLAAAAAFRLDRMGATNALKRTIQTLIDQGFIREVGRNDMAVMYNNSGKAYMVSNTSILKGES